MMTEINSPSSLDLKQFLGHIFLFEGMNHEEIQEIACCAKSKLFKRGELIFSQGEEAFFFFIIVRGKVKISKYSKEGLEQILHLHGEGEVLAEAALFDSMHYPGTCTALEESLLVMIPKEEFIGLIMKYPKLALKMLSAYSRRLRGFVHTIESLTQKDVQQRIVRFILKEARQDLGNPKFWICPLHHTKKELALMLNTSAESFSRVLSKLKKKNLIEENEEGLVVLNIEALKEI